MNKNEQHNKINKMLQLKYTIKSNSKYFEKLK